jgi:hypothetical protein
LIKTENSGSKRTVRNQRDNKSCELRNNKSCELRNNKSCEIMFNKAVRKTIHREWEKETIKAALPIKYK